jgi:hypothetical protein
MDKHKSIQTAFVIRNFYFVIKRLDATHAGKYSHGWLSKGEMFAIKNHIWSLTKQF